MAFFLAALKVGMTSRACSSSLILFTASIPNNSTIFSAVFSPQPLIKELDKNSIKAFSVVIASFS